jgi:type II secretory pathway pseudopilin PulG
MMELVIVVLIVLAAAVYVGRVFYKGFKQKRVAHAAVPAAASPIHAANRQPSTTVRHPRTMPIDNRFIRPVAADPVLVLTPDFDSFIITDSISGDTSS